MKMSGTFPRVARTVARAYGGLVSLIPNPKAADKEYLLDCIVSRGLPAYLAFDIEDFKSRVRDFVASMRVSGFQYRYCPSIEKETLYSSIYACLILSLFGDLDSLEGSERRAWADYIDAHQTSRDGLFRDPAIQNGIFENADWWGARHLALHAIAAYAALGTTPRYRFAFLDRYKDPTYLRNWLDETDWNAGDVFCSDLDNKLMNVVCLLQYERDRRDDAAADRGVKFVRDYLFAKMDPGTGLWGKFDWEDPAALSRAVQFAYHLYSFLFYDGLGPPNPTRLIDLALKTQNRAGGYGATLNSSACEDIDSIDVLVRFSEQTGHRRRDIRLSLQRGLIWQLANQNVDGGFSFRRNEPFAYGHELMSSCANESAMFPTWFRALAIARAAGFLRAWTDARFVSCPGLQYA